MLAMGACERIKKLSRTYPTEIIASPVMDELVRAVGCYITDTGLFCLAMLEPDTHEDMQACSKPKLCR